MTKFGDVRIDALRFFGQNVRHWRLARQPQLTITMLADRIGMDPGALWMIETACNVELTLTTAAEIADALGVPLADLCVEPRDALGVPLKP